MRLSYLLLFLLSFSVTVVAQVPANEVAPEDAAFNAIYAHHSIPTVKGKLLNLVAGEWKTLTIQYTLVTPFSESQVSKTTTAKPDGSFSLVLDYAFPYQQIWFAVGDFFYAGLYANQDLYLELDMKKIKAVKEVNFNGPGVRYLGTDGPMNTYRNDYILYKRPEQLHLSSRINEVIGDRKGSFDSLRTVYELLCDSVKMIEDSYIAAKPSHYSWMLENERLSDYYAQLCLKYWGKVMDDALWQKIKQHKSFLVSNSSAQFYGYLCTYIKTLPGERISISWKDVAALPDLSAGEKAAIDSLNTNTQTSPAPYSDEEVYKWIRQLKPRMNQLLMIRNLAKNIHKVDSLFAPAKADFMKLTLNTSKDVNEQKMAMKDILASMHTGWCSAVLKSDYTRTVNKVNEINATLAKSAGGTQANSFGKSMIETSFGASMYNASGMNADDFLVKLKQSFPGKAIVIDLWATWCVPCLGEMQHSKELLLASKDLPVVFVYLCTLNSSSESKWKSKVIELQQPGIHFLIDEKLDAGLAHYFSFNGYPGHALIDKSGQYRPGAIKWMSEIADREALAALINK